MLQRGVASAPTIQMLTRDHLSDNKGVQAMRIAKKVSGAVAGVSVLSLVGLAVPVSAQSNISDTAAPIHKNKKKELKKQVVALDQKANEAVDVMTELDCTNHTLTAKVTNKTNGDITPDVTFNDIAPQFPSTSPIKPGKTGTYFYNFSGNHMMVDVAVAVDTYDTMEVSPTIHCSEPVSFKADATSESAVTGYLQNNNSLVSQTVLLRVGNGDIRTEILAPGESRLVALPFTAYEGQTNAYVTVATTNGFESTYSVNLIGTVGIPVEPKAED